MASIEDDGIALGQELIRVTQQWTGDTKVDIRVPMIGCHDLLLACLNLLPPERRHAAAKAFAENILQEVGAQFVVSDRN